jgi:hypothetical protein
VNESLKIHDPAADAAMQEQSPLAALSAAFCTATGWTLRLRTDQRDSDTEPPSSDLTRPTSATPSTGIAPGPVSLELSPARTATVRARRGAVESLGRAIAALLGELAETRHALWQREAELAAAIPVAARASEPDQLAERLDAILRGGCEALGCTAAGLYLLDESTTQLKLRATWGLARQSLAEPARPLRGAMADLEALTGHAVVLASASLCRLWHAPKPCDAALCVPVASASAPLGTLWFFAAESRDFDARETQLGEIIAGRLCSELEREVLLTEAATIATTQRRQRSLDAWAGDFLRLPAVAVEGWSLTADVSLSKPSENTATDEPSFADALTTPAGAFVLALGRAHLPASEGYVAIAALRAALRSHAPRVRRASQLLSAIHATIQQTFAGDVFASLALAVVHPNTGWFSFTGTGQASAAIVRGPRSRRLASRSEFVGAAGDPSFTNETGRLARGDRLLLAARRQTEDSPGMSPPPPGALSALDLSAFARWLSPASAVQTLESLRGRCGAVPEARGADSAGPLSAERKSPDFSTLAAAALAVICRS